MIALWGVSTLFGGRSGVGETSSPTPIVSGPGLPSLTLNPSQEANPQPIPDKVQTVSPGEVTEFRAEHNGHAYIDAASSGVATYRFSSACDVPEYPCYVPPALDKVARMDVGVTPSVPSTNTCYLTGHSNWRAPQDATMGVFSQLQNTQVGDSFTVTTTKGTFSYTVTRTIASLPFDQLRSNVDIKAVQPNTCVVISCHIDGRGYSGNFVAFATLTSARPGIS